MHARQLSTSPQWLIGMLQLPFSKFGQVAGKPTEDGVSSSPPAPQILSFPAQPLTIPPCREAVALAIAAIVFGSVRQSVPGGSLPFSLPCSHVVSAFDFAWTKPADAFAIAS